MAKKSYNPFKLWGSYVAVFLGLIYYLIATQAHLFDTRDILLKIGFTLSASTGGHFSGIFLMVFISFLVGWGIHSLVRALRR